MDQPTSPQDHDRALLQEGGAAGALIEAKDRILDEFVSRVRGAFPAAAEPPRPIIVNTLPMFLTELALALSKNDGRDFAGQCSNIGGAHGNERARLTDYGLDDLLHEYQVLRLVIFDELEPLTTLTREQRRIVETSIDEAMRQASASFIGAYEELRNQVAATLTHDLRGPLSAANNYIELVARAGASPEARARFCAGAMRNITRVRQMIEDLLDHSRAGAGERIPLQLGPCELVGLVGEVLSDLTSSIGDRFVLDAPARIEGVWCENSLKRACFNLVENAAKYAPHDMPVSVSLRQDEGMTTMAVQNFGPLIPREELMTLFDAFRRGSEAERGSTRGWGLGLAAVQLIAEAHGGSVVAESSVQQGTVFTLSIPTDAAAVLRRS